MTLQEFQSDSGNMERFRKEIRDPFWQSVFSVWESLSPAKTAAILNNYHKPETSCDQRLGQIEGYENALFNFKRIGVYPESVQPLPPETWGVNNKEDITQ